MSNDREKEIEERRYKRLKRWFYNLPNNQRHIPEEDLQRLKDEGLADADGLITPKGELQLHQLETRKWMSEQGLTKEEKKKLERRRLKKIADYYRSKEEVTEDEA